MARVLSASKGSHRCCSPTLTVRDSFPLRLSWELIRGVGHVEIPDGTIFAVSELAEPRVIVPWQDHPSTLAELARLETTLLAGGKPDSPDPKNRHRSLSQSFSSASQDAFAAMLEALPRPNVSELLPTPNFRGDGSAWELYAKSCPPESPARKQVSSLKAESAGSATIGRTAPPKGKTTMLPDGQLKTRGFRMGFGKLAKRSVDESEATVEIVDKISAGPKSKRRWPGMAQADKQTDPDHVLPLPHSLGDSHSQTQLARLPRHLALAALESPGKAYPSAGDVYDSEAFSFIDVGMKGIEQDAVCTDETVHQIQGAFYSVSPRMP